MPLDGCQAIQRDQLRTAEGARRERDLNTPATGLPNGRRAYHSNPLDWTGNEGLHQLRQSGPRCLQRAYVKSAAAAFPLGDLRESESSLRSDPGSRGRPQVSMAGNPGKAR